MNDLQTLIFTVLGVLLIGLAIWLIVVRRDSGRNAGEFLGMKFDLSTPGLAVLIVGCGLLVVPTLVPHRPGGLPSIAQLFSGGTGDSGEGARVVVQQAVVSEELEPNDSIGSANVIEVGQTLAGSLTVSEGQDGLDYFVLQSPTEPPRPKRMIVRTRGSASYYRLKLTVWDGDEQELAEEQARAGDTISIEVPAAAQYAVRLSMTSGISTGSMDYEFVIHEM